MGRRGGHRHDQAVDLLWNHDPVRNLVRTRDVVQHPQVPLQDNRVRWLSLPHRKAVYRELADGDRIIKAGAFRHVVLGEGVKTDQPARLPHVELKGEVAVVDKLVSRQVVTVGHGAVGLGNIGVLL